MKTSELSPGHSKWSRGPPFEHPCLRPYLVFSKRSNVAIVRKLLTLSNPPKQIYKISYSSSHRKVFCNTFFRIKFSSGYHILFDACTFHVSTQEAVFTKLELRYLIYHDFERGLNVDCECLGINRI